MSLFLKEAERLHDLGMAIHWCRPRSKAPVNSKWTTGPRATWMQLKDQYKEGMNVGVRLGKASRMNECYLAVIDFDLKSSHDRHQSEMLEALEGLFPKLKAQAPLVASGRANGSGHIYVVTSKPCTPARLAQSIESVKVVMPSVKPSKNELKNLTEAEITKGIRLRPAWEISQMGDGQQVVLPPSIHPDSKKEYVWTRPISDTSPLLQIVPKGKEKAKKVSTGTSSPVNVPSIDLSLTNVSPKIIKILETGIDDDTGSDDQSALAFKVAIALVNAGLSDDEIVGLLIDRGRYALASVGYVHRKTENPANAASWVGDYCVAKARKENDLSTDFDRDVVLSEEEIKRIDEMDQESPDLAWLKHLDRNVQTQKPLKTIKNIRLILQNDVHPQIFRFNEFAAQMIYGADAPWNSKKKNDAVTDIDQVNVQSWLADKWHIEPSKNSVGDAIEQIASENRFHPVRSYILNLKWDGIPRINTWLKDYLGADAREPYLSAISRKVLCAMVARVFVPGIKFDHVLVLEGVQGVGKSTVVNILGGEWTLDATLDLRDKDSVQSMFGRWVVELGELASLRAADLETMKAFISRRVDHIRVSYGKWAQDYPRQCIFIGTTNEDQYLKDSTGERRFWPVKTQATLYDLKGLKKVRDQLIAEAHFCWSDCGENLWLNEEENNEAKEEQNERTVEDIWIEIFADFLAKNKHPEEGRNWSKITMKDVFSDFGPIPGVTPRQPEMKRAASVLRILGYKSAPGRIKGKSAKTWVRG